MAIVKRCSHCVIEGVVILIDCSRRSLEANVSQMNRRRRVAMWMASEGTRWCVEVSRVS